MTVFLVAAGGVSLLVDLDNRVLSSWGQELGRFVNSPLIKLEGPCCDTNPHHVQHWALRTLGEEQPPP